MYLPSRIKLKYIGWFLAVLLVFPVFKDIFVHIFLISARRLDFSYRQDNQLRQLQEEKVRLSLELDRLKYLEQENSKLKKAINIMEQSEVSLVYAKIIGFSPSTWRRIAYLSAGKDQGVHQDSLAINEEGALVGKVIEVGKNSSTLVLLNDPEFSLPVFIQEKGMGWLQGSLGGDIAVHYVEANQDVREGDQVAAAHNQARFMVKVGTVKTVRERKDDFFLDIRIVPSAGANALREVFILN